MLVATAFAVAQESESILDRPCTVPQIAWRWDQIIDTVQRDCGVTVVFAGERLREAGIVNPKCSILSAKDAPLGDVLWQFCASARLEELTFVVVRDSTTNEELIEFTTYRAAFSQRQAIPFRKSAATALARLLASPDRELRLSVLRTLLRFGDHAETALPAVERLAADSDEVGEQSLANSVAITLRKHVDRDHIPDPGRMPPPIADWPTTKVSLPESEYSIDEFRDEIRRSTGILITICFDDLATEGRILKPGPRFAAHDEPLWSVLWKFAALHRLTVVLVQNDAGAPVAIELRTKRGAYVFRGKPSFDAAAVEAVSQLLDSASDVEVESGARTLGELGAESESALPKLRAKAVDRPSLATTVRRIEDAIRRRRAPAQ